MSFSRQTLLPAFCATSLTLSAQTVVELDPVNVSAEAATTPSLTVTTVDAARDTLSRVAGGAEVVDPERYLRGRASTLADTFALSPGVFAQPRFGADEARISIRGSGLQRTFHGRGLRILQDGVPINGADGSFDMQALEPTAAAHVDVWRGANALAHGGATLGGAIDYVSRTGRSDPGYLGRLEAGSWNYLRTTLGGGFAQGTVDGHTTFAHASQDGFRDHAQQSSQRLFTNLGWRLTGHLETRLFFTAVRTDSELPGNLTKAQLENDPRQANPANIAGDQHRDFDLLRVASKTTATFGDSAVSLLAGWTYKDLDHPIGTVVDQLSNDAVVGLAFAHDGDILAHAHRFRAGVHFQRGETNAVQYANVGGTRGVIRQRDDQLAQNLELHAESQLELGAGFTGVLGVSVSQNRRQNIRLLTTDAGGTPVAAPTGTTYDRDFDFVAPKIGLRWENSDRSLQFHVNVSGSHEPPSLSEGGAVGPLVLANRAQEALTYEIGTRGTHGPVRWDFAVYHARIDDELLAISLPGPATGTLNADRTIHQGVELGLEADLLGAAWNADKAPDHRLVLRAAWTYGDFRFDGPVPGVAGSNDNRIAGVAPHLLRGELVYENHAGWYLGPTFEWAPSKSYIDHANTFWADSYALLGFKLGFRRERGLSWFIEGRNLTDETHAATHGVILDAAGADSAQFLPGDGRAVYLGVEYRF